VVGLADLLYPFLAKLSRGIEKGGACAGDDIANAANAVERIINGSDKLAAVQGPPGTGKTRVYVTALADKVLNSSAYAGVSSGVLPVYVAPSNMLTLETAARSIYQALINQVGRGGRISFRDLREVLSWIRVYGSKVSIGSSPAIKAIADLFGADQDEVERALKVVVGRVDRDVKLILSTEWQDISRAIRSGLSQQGVSSFVDILHHHSQLCMSVDTSRRHQLSHHYPISFSSSMDQNGQAQHFHQPLRAAMVELFCHEPFSECSL